MRDAMLIFEGPPERLAVCRADISRGSYWDFAKVIPVRSMDRDNRKACWGISDVFRVSHDNLGEIYWWLPEGGPRHYGVLRASALDSDTPWLMLRTLRARYPEISSHWVNVGAATLRPLVPVSTATVSSQLPDGQVRIVKVPLIRAPESTTYDAWLAFVQAPYLSHWVLLQVEAMHAGFAPSFIELWCKTTDEMVRTMHGSLAVSDCAVAMLGVLEQTQGVRWGKAPLGCPREITATDHQDLVHRLLFWAVLAAEASPLLGQELVCRLEALAGAWEALTGSSMRQASVKDAFEFIRTAQNAPPAPTSPGLVDFGAFGRL